MFGVHYFGQPYLGQAPIIPSGVPHVVSAFARYEPFVTGMGRYEELREAFARYDDTVEALADQGEV